MLDRSSPIWVAGHRGLAGSAIVRKLVADGWDTIVTRTHDELDLTDQRATRDFVRDTRPRYVIVAAARVGGIVSNASHQAEFLYENLAIATNVVHSAFENGVETLLFLGSSCVYPREAPQPIAESSLLSGPLEPTNEGYAIAKIAGLKLCEMLHRQHGRRFLSAMPTNLYGPGDNFHPEHSHVIPGLMRRIHDAKRSGAPSVTIWGSGTPLREFLHADDLADAIVHILDHYDEPETINIGSGEEITIRDLASLICEIAGYEGALALDASRPDGTPRKRLDTTKLRRLGWKPSISLREGLRSTWEWAIETGALDRDEGSGRVSPPLPESFKKMV